MCSQPPLQLITANITSWFSGWPQLLHDHVDSSGPCIYLVCETHLTHSGSRACLAGLHRLGLHGVFRCCPSFSMSSSAGVAIISSLPVREASWKSPSLQKLACDGRLIHATCAIAGSQPLHLVVFYGYASGTINPAVCQTNEEALTDITEECMSWGQVPVVLAGDFNVKVGDSLSLNNLLLYGRWVDAAAEHARRCGDLPPPPTCFKNPCSSKGTRIDGVFLSPCVAKGFLTLSYPASGLPTHQPLVVDLNVDPLKVFIVKHKTPRRAKLDPSFVRPSLEECAKHVEKLWRISLPL